jgi:Leucine-rich repeat (LRR) protein
LKALPDTFVNLSSPQVFRLDKCPSLQQLAVSFGALSLEELTLESCGLERLLDNFGKLLALKKLSLGILERDDLVELCDSFGLCSGLEILELTLNGSKFKKLPENFGLLTMLVKLTISNANCLVELPDDIGHISSLRCVRLLECKRLKTLPDSWGNPFSPQPVLPQRDQGTVTSLLSISTVTSLLSIGVKVTQIKF